MRLFDPARTGVSLIESLVSLAIFSFVILAALGFFGTAREAFYRIRDSQTACESATAALEKIRTDILQAGRGLFRPLRLNIVKGIETESASMTLTSMEKESALLAEAAAGATTILVADAEGFASGKTVCLYDLQNAEVVKIAAVNGPSLTLASPLVFNYSQGEGRVLLLQKISLYLDAAKSILRRKVNASPAQPLLEEVEAFTYGYVSETCIADISLKLAANLEKEYGIKVFPKNLALAK
jgi:type II secretory pathway pseudopilin PulG